MFAQNATVYTIWTEVVIVSRLQRRIVHQVMALQTLVSLAIQDFTLTAEIARQCLLLDAHLTHRIQTPVLHAQSRQTSWSEALASLIFRQTVIRHFTIHPQMFAQNATVSTIWTEVVNVNQLQRRIVHQVMVLQTLA